MGQPQKNSYNKRQGCNANSRKQKTGQHVAKCTLHDLRRPCITNWAKVLPIHVVQKLVGHADIKTTRKYYLVVRPEYFSSAGDVLKHILSETAAD